MHANNHKPATTILVPNYKTPDITKLCLRLIRKHTDCSRIQVIAIDNDSCDESTDYLRSLSWIRLIERKTHDDGSPGKSHANALDEALSEVTTPFVLSIHTDTLVRKDGWLDYLLAEINRNTNIAGVGSWKLESKRWLQNALKTVETAAQKRLFPLVGKGYGRIQGIGDNHFYLRSHCALYRTDLLRSYGLSFAAGEDTAGKFLHRKLVEQGHEMVFLPTSQLAKYMIHLNHATGALNPWIREKRKHVNKDLRRINRYLRELKAAEILADRRLDQ